MAAETRRRSAASILADLEGLLSSALRILGRAEARSPRRALAALSEARRTLEVIAQVAVRHGELDVPVGPRDLDEDENAAVDLALAWVLADPARIAASQSVAAAAARAITRASHNGHGG